VLRIPDHAAVKKSALLELARGITLDGKRTIMMMRLNVVPFK
jgi:hypothetical protein